MTQRKPVRPSDGLANVRYEIRGKLARRALALERLGYDIVSLNIGNPFAFGFRTPETVVAVGKAPKKTHNAAQPPDERNPVERKSDLFGVLLTAC